MIAAMANSLVPFRIEYLRRRYFDHLPADSLHTTIAQGQKSEVTPRTVRNWLGGTPSVKVNPRYAVPTAALYFAKDFERTPGDKQREIAEKLQSFIDHGTPGPYSIFARPVWPSNVDAEQYQAPAEFGLQLTCEHMLPFVGGERVQELLKGRVGPADLADLSELTRAQAFLRGGLPNDWAMVAAVAIERPEEKELLEAAQRSQLVVLTSAAGDGKSTLLRRLALTLNRAGQEVHFFFAPPIGGEFPRPPVFDVPTYVLIDSGQLCASYQNLTDAIGANPNLHVVIAARHYEWSHHGYDFRDLRALEVPIRCIDDVQARALARRIIAFGVNLAGASEDALTDRILKSVRSDRYPHLLAAMMSGTSGKDFAGVIDDIIRAFEKGGDGAALRYVACGTLTHEISAGAVELLPHYLFVRLVAERLGVAYEDRTGRDQVRAKLMTYSSEILPIQSNTQSNLTVYDLRHPDIAHRVIERCYNGRWAALSGHGRHLAARYAPRTAQRWLSSGGENAWLTAPLAPRLARSVSDSFGNTKDEKTGKSEFLSAWAIYEANKPFDEDRDRNIDSLFEAALEEAPHASSIWVKWANYKEKHGVAQARAVYVRAWSGGNETPHLMVHWAEFERRAGNLGTRSNPAQGSARWIFQRGAEKGLSAMIYATAWARFEHQAEQENAEPPVGRYSARWILAEAWKAGVRVLEVALLRARIEAANGNLGDFAAPEFLSARWLLRNGIAWSSESDIAIEDTYDDRMLSDEQIVDYWTKLETEHGHVGEWYFEGGVLQPEKYSARWIFLEAVRRGLKLVEVLTNWCKIEAANGNLGDFAAPEFLSARWLLRNGITWFGESGVATENARADRLLSDEQAIDYWTKLEAEHGHVGEWDFEGGVLQPEKYSARWIFLEALRRGLKSPGVLISWCKIEERCGHLGDLVDPEPYSVRWICRDALRRGLRLTGYFYNYWIGFEIRMGNLTGDPAIYPASYLLGKRLELGEEADPTNLYWEARIREMSGNLGSFDNPKPDTARAAYRELSDRFQYAEKMHAAMEYHAPDHEENVDKKYSAEWFFERYKADGGRAESLQAWLGEASDSLSE